MNYDPHIAIFDLMRLALTGDRDSVGAFCKMYVRRVRRTSVESSDEYQAAVQTQRLMQDLGFIRPDDVLRGGGDA